MNSYYLKITKLLFGAALVFSYSSCQKDTTMQNDLDVISPQLQSILSLGFSKDKIVDYENFYLVEGCYIFYKDGTEVPNGGMGADNSNNGKKSQIFRNFGTKVTLANANVRIFVANSIPISGVDNWRPALDNAVAQYNALTNLYLNLQVVSSASLADIIIQSDEVINSSLRDDVYAAADFPLGNGKPGRNMYINLDWNSNQTISEAAKTHILVHELGHTLGLGHTDLALASPYQQIPGTPPPSTGDLYSVMNSSYNVLFGWLGFSNYDIIALQYVYGKKINVSIDGPRKASNSGSYTWTAVSSGGITPYTYKWYRQYGSVTTWEGPISTQSSYTSTMPINNNLQLKLVSTDATGITDSTTILVLNGPGRPILQ